MNKPHGMVSWGLLVTVTIFWLNAADAGITQECKARTSSIRVANFKSSTEGAINKCINKLLTYAYEYQSMQFFFDEADVAFPGLEYEFSDASKTEFTAASQLMQYQTLRGGCVQYDAIQGASNTNWQTPLFALQKCLSNSQDVQNCFNTIHTTAKSANDGATTGYLESKLIPDRIQIIKKVGAHITNAKRVGSDGLGQFLFDKMEKWNFGW